MARTTYVHDNDTSGLICCIKSGTYTGDGGEATAITGIGFTVQAVVIWPHYTVDTAFDQTGDSHRSWGTDQMAASFADLEMSNLAGLYDHKIVAYGSDGFSVDDNAADFDPNKNGRVYDYLAWGVSGN